jgi:hypothetical protein
MKTIRHWQRDWAIVDLIAFGIGAVLTVGFVVYRQQHLKDTSPFIDLWPNIATEVIGIWLSVRLIDGLISRRERRDGVRRFLISNLNYLRERAGELLPRVYDFNVNKLENEYLWAQERLARRLRYLDESEKVDLQNVYAQLKSVLAECTSHLEFEVKVNELDVKLRTQFHELEDARTEIRDTLDEFRYSSDPNVEQMEQTLLALAETRESFLRRPELQDITDFCKKLTGPTDNPLGPHKDLPDIERLSVHNQKWFSRANDLYGLMRDQVDFDFAELQSVLIKAKREALAMPPAVSTIMHDYLAELGTLTSHRQALRERIPHLINAIDRTRHNLMEETDLD